MKFKTVLQSFYLFIFCIGSFVSFAQTSSCNDPSPLCVLSNYEYPIASNIMLPPGNNYGCIGAPPGPVLVGWYYAEVRRVGPIDLTFNSDNNLSVAAWGPFPDLATASGSCGALPNPAACSNNYSSNAESISISGAVGEYFLILVKGLVPPAYLGQFSVTQTNLSIPGAGGIACVGFNQLPFGAGCPTSILIENCNDPLPEPYTNVFDFTNAGGDISALCTDRVSLTVEEYTNGGTNCPGDPKIVERRYYLMDQCGSLASCTQQIVFPVLDDPLELYCPPSDAPSQLVTCLDDLVVNIEDIVALNACGVDLSYDVGEPYINEASLGLECDLTCLHYPVTVTDECGREAECTLSFTVYGNAPDFVNDIDPLPNSCRVDTLKISCENDIFDTIDNWIDTLSVFSTCGNQLEVTTDFNFNNFENICSEEIYKTQEITLTARDVCGRMSTCKSNISLLKNSGPKIATEAKNKWVTCSQNVDSIFQVYLEENGYSNAFDYCSTTFWSTNPANPEYFISCDDGEGLSIDFIASDDCGNSSITTGVFKVINDQTPTLEVEAENLSIECTEDVGTAFDFWLTDNGGAQVNSCGNVSWSTLPANPMVPNLNMDCTDGELEVTFLSVDECGQEVSTTATFTIEDNTAPIFTFVPSLETEMAIAEDECSEVTITTSDEVNGGQIIRTYTATDACGNSTTATATFGSIDNTNPVINSYPNELPCGGVLDPSMVDATDDSGQVSVTVTLISESGTCNSGLTYVYEIVAMDPFGNSTSETVTYNIDPDNTPPVFTSVPKDLTFFCSEAVNIPNAEATDECGEVTITCTQSLNAGAVVDNCNNGYGYDIFKTWTATDACGNTSLEYTSAWVVPDDYIGPKFEFVPEDMEIKCGEETSFGEAVCTTACGNVVLTFEDINQEGNCESGGVLTRIWTGVDDCGNVATAQQIITIPPDTEEPIFTFIPVTETIDNIDEMKFGTPKCEDNCSSLSHLDIEFVDTPAEDGCGLTRAWIVYDLCGNSAKASQTIMFNDVEAPQFFDAPEQIEISCGEFQDFIQPRIEDNWNDYDLTILDQVGTNLCTGVDQRIRTWIATDNCGNENSFQQVINTIDNIAPEFEALTLEKTINCNEGISFDQAKSFDNCTNEVSLEYIDVDQSIDNCSNCIRIIKRTWTAVDDCGNEENISQTITIKDTEAPIFETIPMSIEISCDSPIDIFSPSASDACSEVTVNFEDEMINGECANNQNFKRIWTATDDSGNQVSVSQDVLFIDNTAPTISGDLETLSIGCNDSFEFIAPDFDDNCSAVSILTSDTEMAPTCSDDLRVAQRTWEATDDCGNMISFTQTLKVEDNTKPTFVELPTDMVITCKDEIHFPNIVAVDDCDSDVEIIFDDEIVEGMDCVTSRSILRQWTAIDDCGNMATTTQIIEILPDTDGPILSEALSSKEVSCEAEVIFDEPKFTDNCSEITMNFEDVLGGDECASTIERIWTAIDNCGNETKTNQMITVIDNTVPTFSNLPDDQVMTYEEFYTWQPPAVLEVADNCSEVDQQFERISNENCSEYSASYIYTASDACGNMNEHHINIQVQDVQPEYDLPTSLDLDCNLENTISALNINANLYTFDWNISSQNNDWNIVSNEQNEASIFPGEGTAELELTVTSIVGCSTTKFVSITCASPNSIQNLEAISTLNLFPNPVKDQLSLSFESAQNLDAEIMVYNLLGKTIFTVNKNISQGNNKIEINTSAFVAGAYLLRIQSEEGFVSQKFVKQ